MARKYVFRLIFFLLVLIELSCSLSDIFFHYNILHTCEESSQNCASIKLLRKSKNSNLFLIFKFNNDDYRIMLHSFESSTFVDNARVNIEDTFFGIRWAIPADRFFSLPVYEGTDFKGTYACGLVSDAAFHGFIMFNNGSSIYIEPIKKWRSGSPDFIAYSGKDVKSKFCSSNSTAGDECRESGFSRSLHCTRENKSKVSCYLDAGTPAAAMALILPNITPLKKDRKPSQYTTKHASCSVLLSADPSYYAKHDGDLESVLIEMLLTIKQVNFILSSMDFDGDGEKDGFKLKIGGVKVRGYTSASGYENYHLGHTDMTKLVKDFRLVPQSDCLSLMFTSMPSISNWISVAFEGGICKDNNNKLTSSENIAIVNTVDSSGNWRPFFVTAWTTMMTVGYAMGSAYKTCGSDTPYPPENDWMNFFSLCARNNIASMLKDQGSCLKYPNKNVRVFLKPTTNVTKAPCGNGKLDPGEECDCGSETECVLKSSCCVPPGKKYECFYDRSKGYECDWSDHCCTSDCKIIPKTSEVFCGTGDPVCFPEAFCNGRGPHCPVSRSASSSSDGYTCGPADLNLVGAATCYAGRCESTVCKDAGLADCTCAAETGNECNVCCQKISNMSNNEDDETKQTCFLAESFGLKPKNGTSFLRYPGTPCAGERFGHCDRYGTCKQFQTVAVSSASILRCNSYSITLWFSLIVYIITFFLSGNKI